MLGKMIAGALLAPIVILVGGIGGCELRKAYYDWQIGEMCAKDGGITIYEHIRITPEMAKSMRRVGGHLSMTIESAALPGDIAFLRGERQVLREGEPSIQRLEQQIVRRSDGKVVGRMVSYGRSGGDFPFTGSHPSHYSCPGVPQHYVEIAKIFAVVGESK